MKRYGRCCYTRTDPKDPSRIKTKRKQKLKEDETGELGSTPGLGRSPGEGKDNPLQYSLPWQFRGPRSLAGHNPWGRKESDMTEQLTHTHTLGEIEREQERCAWNGGQEERFSREDLQPKCGYVLQFALLQREVQSSNTLSDQPAKKIKKIF